MLIANAILIFIRLVVLPKRVSWQHMQWNQNHTMHQPALALIFWNHTTPAVQFCIHQHLFTRVSSRRGTNLDREERGPVLCSNYSYPTILSGCTWCMFSQGKIFHTRSLSPMYNQQGTSLLHVTLYVFQHVPKYKYKIQQLEVLRGFVTHFGKSWTHNAMY